MEEAKPMADTKTKASADSGKVIKYVGTAHVREIDAAAWKSVGVEGQNKVVWDEKNNWTVSVQDLTDAAVAWMDENEETLVLADADTK
jgi:hypothetical protein